MMTPEFPQQPTAAPPPGTAAPARRRASWRDKLLAVLIALLGGLALAEVAARILFPAPPDPYREPPLLYVDDDELSYFHVPNQQGWLDDGLVTINSLGLRGREVAVPKPAGCYRIVILGDSLTLGWGVHDEDTFCVQLEQLLRSRFPGREIEVVNLAVSGYNTRQEAILLDRFMARLRPNLVLVGFYWNDLPPLIRSKKVGESSVDDTRTVAATSPERGAARRMVPTDKIWLRRILRQSRTGYLTARLILPLVKHDANEEGYAALEQAVIQGESSPALTAGWQAAERNLQRMRTTCATHNCGAGLIALPGRGQVEKDDPNARYQSELQEIAKRQDWFVIDPLPVLREQRPRINDLFIPYDRHHTTRAGHALIAQAIADSVGGRYLESAGR